MHSFEDMTIWIFCRFGLKCIFSPPNFWFLGVRPLNVIGHHRDHQKAHPWPKPHLHAEFGADWSIGATCARAEGIKKKEKKARKETYSGKVGVRPDHPRWRSDMWSCVPCGLREVVLSFKFRQNRLNSFRDLGGRNLPFPILTASGLYNSLYYRTSRDRKNCMQCI